MTRLHRFALSTLAVSAIAGCGGATVPCDVTAPAHVETSAIAASSGLSALNLNAVLWVQTSVEYATTTLQTYRLASAQLDAGLADSTWLASPEQSGDVSALPPAVIMDLDETVLDNSPYQAWLVQTGNTFSDDSWTAWCNAEQALAVPGALEFVQDAVDQGVTVFFISNRGADVEDATRANLEALGFGFALSADFDNVLLKRELPEWGSDKGTRRMVVGETHRIVLSIGDNLGDFVDGYKVPVEDRDQIVADNAAEWGTRWIMLPNPTYGSWEQTLYGFDYGASAADQETMKRDHLNAWTGE